MAIRAYKPKTLPRRWEVIWHERTADGRKQCRKAGFLTRGDALDFEARKRRERLVGANLIEPSLIVLDDYLTEWLESQADLAAGTVRNRRQTVAPLRPIIGHVPISQLTSVQIEQAYATLRADGYSESFVRYTHRSLKQALKRAVMHQMIATNPCDRVKPPRMPTPQTTTWTREQMQTFLRVNGNDAEWGDFWATLCETWLRVAEITDLRWSDIDLTAGTITVSHSVKRDAAFRYFSGSTKTTQSNRVIRISNQLRIRLTARKLADPQSKPDDLVFRSPRGNTWLSSQHVGRMLKRHAALADVPAIKVHEVRHSGGSIAYLNGVDIKTISERLGHKSIALTLSIYTHLNDDHHKAAAEAIAGLLEHDCEDLVSADELDQAI